MSRMFGTSIDVGCIRRRKRLIFGTSICFIITNSLFVGFARLGPVQTLRNDTYFMVAPRPTIGPILVWDIISVISIIIASAAFVLPPVSLLILCSIIGYQFQKFTERFAKCMKQESNFKGCLIALRRQHQYLSKTVFVIDDAFGFYLAVSLGTVIIMACFIMYQLVVAQSNLSNPITVLMLVFWLGVSSMKFALIGILTAQVHEKVQYHFLRSINFSLTLVLPRHFCTFCNKSYQGGGGGRINT